MADEQKPKKAKKAKPEAEDGVLNTAAKAIGTAAGKIAVAAGVTEAPAPQRAKSVKVPKLKKKNKSRLPRRKKKALQKAAPTAS